MMQKLTELESNFEHVVQELKNEGQRNAAIERAPSTPRGRIVPALSEQSFSQRCAS
jgi:hypothetical protein